ncbi:MAG: hypothetical protein DWQ36_15105 [Acidobacteria bacterium]|nr:MAG: hypothetical protein DWQ30_00205 [Acidobacteriota bacterium]REK06220.1 MAG: hypothetical protein DWQ36_15105 [Acidobacteriota bacterium]
MFARIQGFVAQLVCAVSALVLIPAPPVGAQWALEYVGTLPAALRPGAPVGGPAVEFGAAVALDRDVLVVGAPLEDSTGLSNSGAVYVYERVGGAWTLDQKLRAPTEINGEQFGYSVGVALGGEGLDYIVVGAPLSPGGGEVYVFRRLSGGAWEHETSLLHLDAENGDRFGEGVAIDYFVPPNGLSGTPAGFFIAVGAPQDNDPGASGGNEGSVSVYQRTGGPPSWGPPIKFIGDEASARLGLSLAMDGPFIVAGGDGYDADMGFNEGGGESFTQANQVGAAFNYVEGFHLRVETPLDTNGLGSAAAIRYDQAPDAIVAALGSPLDDLGGFDVGRVFVYDLDPEGQVPENTLTEVAIVQAPGLPAQARFGTSIAMWSDVMMVGAPGIQPDGAVYVFEMGGGVASFWNFRGVLLPPSPPVDCVSGQAVAVQWPRAGAGCFSLGLEEDAVFVHEIAFLFFDGFESGDAMAWSATSP